MSQVRAYFAGHDTNPARSFQQCPPASDERLLQRAPRAPQPGPRPRAPAPVHQSAGKPRADAGGRRPRMAWAATNTVGSREARDIGRHGTVPRRQKMSFVLNAAAELRRARCWMYPSRPPHCGQVRADLDRPSETPASHCRAPMASRCAEAVIWAFPAARASTSTSPCCSTLIRISRTGASCSLWLMAIGGLLYRSFASSGGGGGVAVAPQTADECSQWGPGSVTDGIWWFVVPRVFHGAAASEGPAVRPGLVECPIAHARTQRGQVIVVVGGARDADQCRTARRSRSRCPSRGEGPDHRPAQRLAIGARKCEAGVSDGRSRSAQTWPECGGLDGYIEQRTRARRGSAAASRRKDIFCRREQCRACQWHEPPVRPPYLSPPTQPA